MIYDPESMHLYTSTGKLIKKLICPIKMTWDALEEDAHDGSSRRCNSCFRRVVDLSCRSDAEVVEMLTKRPQTCVYVNPSAANLTILGAASMRSPSLREIRTARSVTEMNEAVRLGFWPLLKLVEHRPDLLHSRVSVYQQNGPGNVVVVHDLRSGPPGDDYHLVHTTSYYPYYHSSPIAAYLLPSDLSLGENVILTDLIEDVVGSDWQGNLLRRKSIEARWNGKDFEYSPTEPAMLIG